MKYWKPIGVFLTSIIASTAGNLAFAASEELDAASRKPIEEVVVYAQKRAEFLVDVPATLLVADAEKLDKAGVVNPSDLGYAFPGLTFTNTNAAAQPAIRGVSTKSFGDQLENSVVVYVDGVLQPSQTANNSFDMGFAESISVLKGPQGTVFGRNVVGGAILVKTRGPDFEEFSAEVDLTTSQYGGGGAEDAMFYRGRAFLNMPIKDNLAASLSIARSDNEGYLKNIAPGGGSWGGSENTYAQAKLLWEPNDAVSLLFNASYSEQDYEIGATVGLEVSRGFGVPGAIIPQEPWQIAQDVPSGATTEQKAFSVTAEFDTEIGTFTSISAYQEVTAPSTVDFDAAMAGRGFLDLYFDTSLPSVVSQEINFASEQFGDFSFVGGVYALDKESEIEVYLNGGDFYLTTRASQVYSFAGFGEVIYDVTDDLTIVAGMRYTYDAEERTIGDFSESHSWTATTKRLAVTYALNDATNVYFSYNEGYKAGLATTRSAADPTAPVKPQYLDAFEVGVKLKTDIMALNISAFHYDYDDILAQRYITTIDPGTGLENTNLETVNAAVATFQGVDVDWNIFITEKLHLSGGVSWLHKADYDDFPGAPVWTLDGNHSATAQDVDLSGTRILKSPEITFSSILGYDMSGLGGMWNLSLSYYYSDDYEIELGTDNTVDSYSTFGLSATYTPDNNSGLTVTAYGRNLTNEDHLTGSVVNANAYRWYYAAPRELGLRVGYKF